MRQFPAALALVLGTVTTLAVPTAFLSVPGFGSGGLVALTGFISSLTGMTCSFWALALDVGTPPTGHWVSSRRGIFCSLTLSFWPWALLFRASWH